MPSGLKDKGEPLVKGDSKSYIIGAASIIAKVGGGPRHPNSSVWYFAAEWSAKSLGGDCERMGSIVFLFSFLFRMAGDA